MRFVITIQGFKSVCNRFIVKECALFTLDERSLYHWLIKPPFDLSELDNGRRREASYLTHNLHGLRWEDGDIDYSDWIRSLKLISDRAETIYAKGKEATLFLSTLLGVAVTNLEDLGCPSIKHLTGVSYNCIHHSLLKENFNCALTTAILLRNWVYYYEHSTASSETSDNTPKKRVTVCG